MKYKKFSLIFVPGYRGDDPELITAGHQAMREYGTLGRMPREQPPPYHVLPRASYLILPQEATAAYNGYIFDCFARTISFRGILSEINFGIIFSDGNVDEAVVHSISENISSGSNHGGRPHMIFPNHPTTNEDQLFHSTKF